MALSDDRVYLLNLLNAGNNTDLILSAPEQDWTVGKVAEKMQNCLKADDANDFRTYEEMWTALETIKNDPALKDMKIVAADRDGDGNLHYIVTTPEGQGTSEAVVIYSGTTGPGEWYDDVIGGGPTGTADDVSTPVQMEMLAWYQSHQDILAQYDVVTTTGHSKGGNLAQYIALMDNSVDRCISFDGQGFSDEFIKKYQDLVEQRQSTIVNYSADKDYVNILLNRVGESRYVKGERCENNFFKNHSPYSMLDLNNPGQSLSGEGRRTQQAQGMHELELLLNSYLRSLSAKEKAKLLTLLADIAAGLMTEGEGHLSLDEVFNLALHGDNMDMVADLLAYIAEYIAQNRENAEELLSLLNELVPNVKLGYFEIKLGNLIREIANILKSGADRLSFYAWSSIAGIFVDSEYLDLFKKALEKYGHHIEISDDITVPTHYQAETIRVDAELMEKLAADLQSVSAALETLAGQARAAANACQSSADNLTMGINADLYLFTNVGIGVDYTPDSVMNYIAKMADDYSSRANYLGSTLSKVAQICTEAEEKAARGFHAVSV